MSAIDLISLSATHPPPVWAIGRVFQTQPDVAAVSKSIDKVGAGVAVLFWDSALGSPDPALAEAFLASPDDCWHGGLKLGMRGLPGILSFTSPTWMLACDAPSEIESTSWRLSMRACLVRTEILRRLGGIRPEFVSLEAAALEMGHRWIRRGAVLRHIPRLVAGVATLPSPPSLAFVDELRFAYYRHGRKWAAWASCRALFSREVSLLEAVSAWRRVTSNPPPAEPAPFRDAVAGNQQSPAERKGSAGISRDGPSGFTPHRSTISILVPTVDRYPYLRTLLGQLRGQTVAPLEIVIVDQTAAERRQPELYREFADLPLRVVWQDEPGQCTSRNAGLHLVRGDFVLFIDDDDEVPGDLLERHQESLKRFQSDVSCGVAEEVGAGALPADFRLVRVSDVFPTNNTMIRREVLERSGLFDLAYNRRPRADGDLGMRIYLTGARMMLNPAISVLHHHAPSGGLRKHKARTVTYAMSRDRLFCRALTSVSEFYLAGRYFPPEHAGEMMWKSVLGTFSLRGGTLRRMAKILVGTCLLPFTWRELSARRELAKTLARDYPQIEALGERGA